MDLWTTTANKFWTWINSVALYIAAVPWQFTSPRTLKLVEVAAGEFAVEGELAHVDVLPNRIYLGEGQTNAHVEYSPTLLRGTRIELILNSDHFLFRPLELPSRAAEFLDGIIKSQIDKLTPWRASDAAFGWTKTDGAEPDRILVTVAAAAQSFVESYIDAVSRLGVQSIAAFTTCVENGSKEPARIKIAEERFIAYFDVDRIRRILIAILVASLSSAAVAVTAATLIGIASGFSGLRDCGENYQPSGSWRPKRRGIKFPSRSPTDRRRPQTFNLTKCHRTRSFVAHSS